MDTPASSLDSLHDIVLPPAAPWWPLAPGWYVVMTILLVATAISAWHAWKRWQANAYRRVALGELADAAQASTVAEILRRTALAIAPREEITGKSGDDWTRWLAAKCPGELPPVVGEQLGNGIYKDGGGSTGITSLKAYAKHWITHHSAS